MMAERARGLGVVFFVYGRFGFLVEIRGAGGLIDGEGRGGKGGQWWGCLDNTDTNDTCYFYASPESFCGCCALS